VPPAPSGQLAGFFQAVQREPAERFQQAIARFTAPFFPDNQRLVYQLAE
jgi:hypothetical protein